MRMRVERLLRVPLITADARLVERCANLPLVWDVGALS